MKKIVKVLDKLFVFPMIYKSIKKRKMKERWRQALKNHDAEWIFTRIFKDNHWGSNDSVSGHGSDAYQTQIIARAIPEVIDAFGITSMLDLPCGDFHWMQAVDLQGVQYIGADIVEDLIKKNQLHFANTNVEFKKLNIIADDIPDVDLVFCRDCLVHLSTEDVFHALNTIVNSKAKYLLTTTFSERASNPNILTGQWRALNLEAAPFHLPKPIRLINEGCTQDSGKFFDKAMGLWKVEEIRAALNSHSNQPSEALP